VILSDAERDRRRAQMARIQKIGAPLGGRIRGPIQGAANIASGLIAALGRESRDSGRLAAITTTETRSKGGRRGIENGHLARMRALPQSEIGQRRGRHTRWHSDRNTFNPRCEFCWDDVIAFA
jgi:hypothetical protein